MQHHADWYVGMRVCYRNSFRLEPASVMPGHRHPALAQLRPVPRAPPPGSRRHQRHPGVFQRHAMLAR